MRARRDFADHFFYITWMQKQSPAPPVRRAAVIQAWDEAQARHFWTLRYRPTTTNVFQWNCSDWGTTMPMLNKEGYPTNHPQEPCP